jgi:hypothetical protein
MVLQHGRGWLQLQPRHLQLPLTFHLRMGRQMTADSQAQTWVVMQKRT